MAKSIRKMLQRNPITLQTDESVSFAAKQMKDESVGDVLVADGDELCGILTDRDIVVRCIAAGKDPTTTKVGDLCSDGLTTLSPDASVDDAIALMRTKAIRRIPIVDGKKPIGVLSLGDLAQERDPKSVLAGISQARPNN